MADARGPDPAAPAPTTAPDGHRFDSGWEPQARDTRQLRPAVPQSFQTRLTFAFMGVVALTLLLVAPVVINRLDDYFRQLEEQGLRSRADATAQILAAFMIASVPDNELVVRELPDGSIILNPTCPHGPRRTPRSHGKPHRAGRHGGHRGSRRPGHRRRRRRHARPRPRVHGAPPGRRRPRPGPRPGHRAAGRGVQGERNAALGPPRHAVQSVHEPRGDPGERHGAHPDHGQRRLPRRRARRGVPRPPLHDAAHPPDRGEPRGSPTGTSPRASPPTSCRRAPSRSASSASSSTRWRTGSRRASTSSAATATAAATSLADVSHELRTPIAAMKMHVELLQGPAGRDQAAARGVPPLVRPAA